MTWDRYAEILRQYPLYQAREGIPASCEAGDPSGRD
jgi:hypothetical protein